MPMQIQESKLPSYSQTKKVKLLFHSSLLDFLLANFFSESSRLLSQLILVLFSLLWVFYHFFKILPSYLITNDL